MIDVLKLVFNLISATSDRSHITSFLIIEFLKNTESLVLFFILASHSNNLIFRPEKLKVMIINTKIYPLNIQIRVARKSDF